MPHNIYIHTQEDLDKTLKDNPDAEEIMINLDKIPNSIAQFKKLRKVSFSRYPTVFPEGLKNHPTLEEIDIQNCSRIKAFPQDLREVSNLKVLRIYFMPNWTKADQWHGLDQLSKLERLQLTRGKLKDIPAEVYRLPNLKHLSLEQYSYHSPKISEAAKNWTRLESIDISGMKDLPEGLRYIPNLKHLIVSAIMIKDNPTKVFDFPGLEHLGIKGRREPILSDIAKFIKWAGKHKPEIAYRSLIRELFAQKQQIADLNDQQLLSIFNAGVPSLIKEANEEIEKRIKIGKIGAEKPLKKGSKLLIIGKLNSKKTLLKNRLKEQGIEVHKKADKTTTHLVLGKNIGNNLKALADNKTQAILTEGLLLNGLDELEKPYLLEKTEENEVNIEHIKTLLLSNNEENVLVAFQLLEGGGQPEGLLTEVFMAMKTPFEHSKTIKKQAGQYIERYGSPELIKCYKKRSALCDKYMRREAMWKNLKTYTAKTELNLYTIIKYMWKHYEQGLPYAFSKLPEDEKTEFIGSLIKDGKLDLANKQTSVPKEILNHGDKITELDLSGGWHLSIPKAVFKLPKLKKLRIVTYSDLELTDKVLEKFVVLEELYISDRNKNTLTEEAQKKAGCKVFVEKC